MWKYIALAVLCVAFIILKGPLIFKLLVSIGKYTSLLFLSIIWQWILFFMILVYIITLYEVLVYDEKHFMDYFTDNFKMLFPKYLSATMLLLVFILTDVIPLAGAFIV